jgi:outer membrane lipoprotein-sorting protein
MTTPSTRRRFLALSAAIALSAPLAAVAQTPPAIAPADQALVDKAVAYLQGLGEAKGRFTQTDARGAVTTGELFLKRPGKARFAYDPPSGLLVVSDGGRVIVQDKRLNTFTAYPLGATPLSLFLAKTIRLDRGVEVTRVARAADGFTITARDGQKKNAGQIALTFTNAPLALVGWAVTDARSQTTNIRISGLAPVSGLDPALFILKDTRPRPADPGRL